MKERYLIEFQGFKSKDGKFYHFTSEYFFFEAYSLEHIEIELTPKMIDFQEKHNIKLLKGYVYSPNDNDNSISNKPPTLLKAFNFYYDS